MSDQAIVSPIWTLLTAPFPATMLAIIAAMIAVVAYIERGQRP